MIRESQPGETGNKCGSKTKVTTSHIESAEPSDPQSGIYVYGLIADFEIQCLIDTGAQKSVLSIDTYEEICKTQNVELLTETGKLCSFDGTDVPILGQVILPLKFGSQTFDVEFLVTKCQDEAILGMPFMCQTSACIDCGQMKLTIDGENIPLYDQNKRPVLSLVRLLHTITLDPKQEYLTSGTIKLRGRPCTEAAVLPSVRLTSRYCVLVGRTLVSTNLNNNRVAVRLFNPGDKSITIPKGSIVGRLERVDILENNEKSDSSKINRVIVRDHTVPEHLADLFDRSALDLSSEQLGSLAQLLNNYGDVFSKTSQDIGRTDLVKHDIILKDQTPIKIPPRYMQKEKQEDADEQIEAALEQGIASRSDSPFSSPLVMVRKKDGTYRMCVDYRQLNSKTVLDAYPLPRIQDTLDTLSGNRWFCSLDLTSGYNQIELGKGKEYTAFCSRKGLFEWNVMPFGLSNAPATFQRLMNKVLENLQWDICLVYLDDILVMGKTVEETMQRLELVFQRLRAAHLKLKPKKCNLFQKEVTYLGHVISGKGVGTCPDKIQAILNWPIPINVKKLDNF